MAGQGNKNRKRTVRESAPALLQRVDIISNENMKVNSYIRNYLINISDNNIRHIIHNLEKIHIFNNYKIYQND